MKWSHRQLLSNIIMYICILTDTIQTSNEVGNLRFLKFCFDNDLQEVYRYLRSPLYILRMCRCRIIYCGRSTLLVNNKICQLTRTTPSCRPSRWRTSRPDNKEQISANQPITWIGETLAWWNDMLQKVDTCHAMCMVNTTR